MNCILLDLQPKLKITKEHPNKSYISYNALRKEKRKADNENSEMKDNNTETNYIGAVQIPYIRGIYLATKHLAKELGFKITNSPVMKLSTISCQQHKFYLDKNGQKWYIRYHVHLTNTCI